MNIRYRVTLSPDERAALLELVQGGKGAVRRLKRAQILLAADRGSTDEEIARNVAVGTSTIYRTKQRFVEEGLAPALGEAPRPGAPRKLGVEEEAILCVVACSRPPSGRAHWTLQLLADEMVRLTVHAQGGFTSTNMKTLAVPLRTYSRERGSVDNLAPPSGRARAHASPRTRVLRTPAPRGAPFELDDKSTRVRVDEELPRLD